MSQREKIFRFDSGAEANRGGGDAAGGENLAEIGDIAQTSNSRDVDPEIRREVVADQSEMGVRYELVNLRPNFREHPIDGVAICGIIKIREKKNIRTLVKRQAGWSGRCDHGHSPGAQTGVGAEESAAVVLGNC